MVKLTSIDVLQLVIMPTSQSAVGPRSGKYIALLYARNHSGFILCAKAVSRYFVCNRVDRANIVQEATTNTVDLPEDDSSTIKLMLNFFYTADYDVDTEDCKVAHLKLHAQMYSLADKYCIDSLMELAKDKYVEELRKNPTVDDYLSSIPEVYVPPATNKALRSYAVAFGRKVLYKALKKDNTETQLRQVICEIPEFGYDILEAFIISPILGNCQNCGSTQVADALQTRCRRCGRGGTSNIY